MVLTPLARVLLLSFLAALLLFGLFSEPRYGLDPSDLDYADTLTEGRPLFGIPGFLNITSAGLITLASLFGIGVVWRAERRGIVWEIGAQSSWLVFFAAAGLASIVSMLLHAAPQLWILMGMKLLIALAIMGLWNALMIERVDATIGCRTAPWFYALAVFAVFYWGWTEHSGAGDMRLYTACVIYPMMVLPMILSLFPLEAGGGGWLLLGWAIYLAAKICEALDTPLLDATHGLISGHTFSHIGQALAISSVGQSIRVRRADSDSGCA
jgi:hypothetical protein